MQYAYDPNVVTPVVQYYQRTIPARKFRLKKTTVDEFMVKARQLSGQVQYSWG